MFLLRRRSDGLYFRNKGFHQDASWCRRTAKDDPTWVKNPSECVPFASIKGLKNSRGARIGTPYPRPAGYKDRAAYDSWFACHNVWYAKENQKARRQWELDTFNKKYEIVEISYTVIK